MHPTFIGIGAPKSGTTWLARCLGEHPSVFMSSMKEIEFWKHADACRRLDEYAHHFRQTERASAIGEFSVRYLSLPGVPERIHAVFPRMKLIVALRNPIEQVTSNFWHLNRQRFNLPPGELGPQSVGEALASDSHREFLLGPARYASHLERFYRLFPEEQIHVIRFEDIKADPASVMRDLFGFLGVDLGFEPPSLLEKGANVRKGTSPKNIHAAKIHEIIYGGLVNRVYNPLKQVIGVRRASRLKDFLRVRHLMETLFMKKGYPELSHEDRKALNAEFKEEIGRLECLTGLCMQNWKES
ncbi:MAG: sulfotransferase [Gammaproteobacteria bacterium]|nr:sulfotransferase [Gammaproteobacteria bacterium]